MTVHEHAEIALLDIEYASAECDVLMKAETDPISSKQLSRVGVQLAIAKRSLLYVLRVCPESDL
jgi:hypothetical protein